MIRSGTKYDQAASVKGAVPISGIVGLCCTVTMIAVFLVIQTFYHDDMTFIVLPLIAIGLLIIYFCLIPFEYVFGPEQLEIRQKLHPTQKLSYDDVYYLESKSQDRFLNITTDNEIKVYYKKGRGRRLTICNPKDVDTFVSELKKHCAALHEQCEARTELEKIL